MFFAGPCHPRRLFAPNSLCMQPADDALPLPSDRYMSICDSEPVLLPADVFALVLGKSHALCKSNVADEATAGVAKRDHMPSQSI